jgi:uncharacterized membrane protein YdjX (TVP38/TMEM64 family)
MPDVSRPRIIRTAVLVFIAVAILTATALLLGTEQGRQLLHDPQAHGRRVRGWVTAHPIIAPAVYISAYVLVGLLALPIWWLEVLAGFGFGLPLGTVWSLVARMIAATGSAALSRFLLANWFHTRVESHMQRLHKLDEQLGHNGLLVVSAIRLAHFLPFGIANYAFGLTTISLRDVAIGTVLGSVPIVMAYVTIGAARHLLSDWRYVGSIALLNMVLLAPLAVRYLRPDWFKRMGIE